MITKKQKLKQMKKLEKDAKKILEEIGERVEKGYDCLADVHLDSKRIFVAIKYLIELAELEEQYA